MNLFYITHRLFYFFRDSIEKKDFYRAVYQYRAKKVKDYYVIQ